MAAIDELIEQIDNPVLRERIAAEVRRVVKQKKFGLVFEEHLPERTMLYEVPVKRGSIVSRNSDTSDLYQVLEIDGDRAICISKSSKEQKSISIAELVSVAEFGEPIYPYLEPLDSVENAPDSGLWHTLIEADNYHALQLLDYMYHGKVDCIYIDKRRAYLIQCNEKEKSPKALDIRGFGDSLILGAYPLDGRFRRNRPMSTHEILPTGANENATV